MVRGKYATRSDAVTARTELSNELAIYQRKVAAQSQTIAQLRDQLAVDKQVHAQRVRVLDQRLREGTSEALEAAHRELQMLRDELGKARRKAEDIQKRWDKVSNRLILDLKNKGMTGAEAIEELMRMVGSAGAVLNTTALADLEPEAVNRIQRARGERR